MALTDYNSLRAAVQTWCARSDSKFTSQFETFVASAEDRIYSGAGMGDQDPIYSPPLRVPVMETSATITITAGQGTFADEVLEIRSIVTAADTIGQTYVPPERREVAVANSPYDVLLTNYTIVGRTIKTVPAVDGVYTIGYYKKFPAITQDSITGPLIAAYPLLYLEATLYEAFTFIRDGELSVAHLTKYRGLVQAANGVAATFRTAGPLRRRTRGAIP